VSDKYRSNIHSTKEGPVEGLSLEVTVIAGYFQNFAIEISAQLTPVWEYGINGLWEYGNIGAWEYGIMGVWEHGSMGV
jgi:hypothetical protein